MINKEIPFNIPPMVGKEKEYVECISFQGEHHFLALTKKYTTGSPHFIETGHLEPAVVSGSLLQRIKNVVFHALDSLEIEFGASHSEIKVSDNGVIKIIEIGARMGGDCDRQLQPLWMLYHFIR